MYYVFFHSFLALRFQISTLAEDLRLGGFTHRRVTVSQLPFPLGQTREQFEYTWLTPDGRPVNRQPSAEMNVQLQSPQDFGVYTVRVRGIHSGYTHELQSEVRMESKCEMLCQLVFICLCNEKT